MPHPSKMKRGGVVVRAQHEQLRDGDPAICLFDTPMGMLVRIMERKEDSSFQSGVAYRINRRMRNCGPDDWFDAGWFRVAKSIDVDKLTGENGHERRIQRASSNVSGKRRTHV